MALTCDDNRPDESERETYLEIFVSIYAVAEVFGVDNIDDWH